MQMDHDFPSFLPFPSTLIPSIPSIHPPNTVVYPSLGSHLRHEDVGVGPHIDGHGRAGHSYLPIYLPTPPTPLPANQPTYLPYLHTCGTRRWALGFFSSQPARILMVIGGQLARRYDVCLPSGAVSPVYVGR